jgi:large subunit ribosomal protein MRP49
MKNKPSSSNLSSVNLELETRNLELLCYNPSRKETSVSIRDAITLNGRPLGEVDLVASDFFEWQPVDVACVPLPGVVAAQLRVGDSELGAPTVTLGDPMWRWRWLPRDAVGVFAAQLVLTHDNGTVAEEHFRIRIRPRTIASEQYEALIKAVQQDAAALVYALHGGSEGAYLNDSARSRSLLEDFYVLVEQLGPAAVALTHEIAAQPHQALRHSRATVALADVDRFDQAMIAAVAQTPPDAVSDGLETAAYAGPLPHTIMAQRSASSTDVVEHRLLKGMLQVLHWRLGLVRAALAQETARRTEHDAVRGTTSAVLTEQRGQRCATAQRALRQAMESPFLVDVKSLMILREPTHLMRRVPRYRRVYELYRSLRSTPLIDWDSPMLWLPIQSLPLLYEQWCVLQVIKALLAAGTVVKQHTLTHDETAADQRRWTLRLRQNVPLLTIHRSDGARLRLFYQRRYQPQAPDSHALGTLDPFVRIPDIAIEVTQIDHLLQTLLLDAKYRVAPDGGVPQDALDDAYAYRNAIGVGGQRATLGAFLLYPGSERVDAADNVGALPLLPMNNKQLAVINKLLDNVQRTDDEEV